MAARTVELPLARYQDGTGRPLAGWVPASRGRRAVAWAIDLVLYVATLGIGFAVTVAKLWPQGTTPGKRLLGLQVFGTDTQRPADRGRMVRRSLVHRTAARVIGICTLGVGYAYILGAAAGSTRRTLYDDWSQTVVLGRTG